MKSNWSKDPDRIAYYENEVTRYGQKSIDELVVHNANIHLEKLSDSEFYLLIYNNIHEWRFAICSDTGRAKIVALLVEDNSPQITPQHIRKTLHTIKPDPKYKENALREILHDKV
jgi:hypothetical protein